jgi:hypothetical protein
MTSYDIVLATIPIQQTMRCLPVAPAYLKAVVQQAGFTCRTFDLNIDLWKCIRDDWNNDYEDMWNSIGLRNMEYDAFMEYWDRSFYNIALRWIEQIRSCDPRWLGFSVFHKFNVSVFFLRWLLSLARALLPNTKLMVGGNAITVSDLGSSLMSDGLVDAYVRGEGEYPILELLKGSLDVPGVNGNEFIQIGDLNSLPRADYSDYSIDDYGGCFYVELTRGCIRNCKYCLKVLPRFRSRRGSNVAEEMMQLQKAYGSKEFEFSDCACNNDLEQFRECLERLIHYYDNNIMQEVYLTGSVSCFPRDIMGAEMYSLMGRADFSTVGVGVESGSERIRYHMGKRFTDEDVDFMLEQCAKNGIYVGVAIIVGYPLETEEDFQKTMDLFSRNAHLKDSIGVWLGATCYLNENSWFHKNQDELGLYIDDYGEWVCGKTGNSMEVRYDRWLRLKEHCRNLGYYADESHGKTLQETMSQYWEESLPK